MEKPKISIILTSFNHESYLREAIDSVLVQTYSNYELFIIDDASSDNSFEIIKSYSDSRIIPIQNEKQKRGIWGYNKIIKEMAKGEYIAIHHSDDVWEPTKLAKQIAFLETHPEIGAIFTNAMTINEDGYPYEDESHSYYSIFDQPNRSRHEWLNFFFYQGNVLCHPSVMIHKECYDNCGLYRYGLAQLGDFDMWIRLCMKYEIYVCPEKLIRFRVRDNEANSSGNTPVTRVRGANEHFYIIESFLNLDDISEILKVFPNASKYIIDGKYVVEFVLAMMALEDKAWRDAKLHGLSLLYKLVNDQNKARKIKDLYNFDYLKLIDISAKYDVFNVENYNNQHFIQLFIEDENGLSEENSIKIPVAQNTNIQEFTFDLSDKPAIINLRLDPLSEICVIEIEALYFVKKDSSAIDIISHISTNALTHHDKRYFFDTIDSNCFFSFVDFTDAQKLIAQIRYLHIGCKALEVCVHQAKTELDQTRTELDQTRTSLSWKITKLLRTIKQALTQKKI